MNNSLLLNANTNHGISIYATDKNADILTCIVAGCLILLTIIVVVKILR